jgi:hypothetical protein
VTFFLKGINLFSFPSLKPTLLINSPFLKKILLLVFAFQIAFHFIHAQQAPFSGELVYKVQRVDKIDSTFSKVLIYAKDSLIKVVSFSSQQGRQELIKHLRLQKSYLLVEINGQKLAIRTNEHLTQDTVTRYTLEKTRGTKKISGLRCHKLKWKHPSLKEPLTVYYHKKIDSKYANVYEDFPGLPVLYFIPTEDGLYRYQLIEIKRTETPLSIFLIPKEYKRISFDELNEVLGE